MAIYNISLEHVGALILIGNKLGIKSTDLKGNELNVNEFKNNTPEWFIFGWPDALENLINKIN